MSHSSQSPDAQVAEMAVGMRMEHVPDDVLDAAVDCIADTVAVGLAGASSEEVQHLSRIAAPSGQALVFGRRSGSSPRDAALLNAVAAHVLDFDDWLPAAGVHPSTPLIAAALAAAQSEAMRVSGKALLAAYVAGFETQARVGASIAPGHYEDGFHPTATVGTFGAAVAAARIAGADSSAMSGALGLASTSAAGIRAAFGTSAKSVQVGKAAENGLLAAQLALGGASAPADAVLGERGFAASHGHRVDIAIATAPFDSRWYLREVAVKEHASCFGTHAPVDAILELRGRCGIDRVSRIEIVVSETMRTVCAIPMPATPLEGKFSLAFTASLALIRGRCGVAEFAERTVSDQALREMAGRVTVAFAPTFTPQQARVTIVCDDGSVLTAGGDSAVPPSAEVRRKIVRGKLLSLATPVLGEAGAVNLLSVVEGLAGDRTVDELVEALTPR